MIVALTLFVIYSIRTLKYSIEDVFCFHISHIFVFVFKIHMASIPCVLKKKYEMNNVLLINLFTHSWLLNSFVLLFLFYNLFYL